MVEWQKKYGKQGLVIIALTTQSYPSAAPMLKKIAEGMGINYKLAQWEQEHSKLPKPLSLVPSYPATILIDRQGRLKTGVFGPWLTQIEKDLKAVLAEKPKMEEKPKGAKPTKATGK
ncbi:MAG: hypothetical protein NZ805_13365 [Armatimonadetes bacterium]|nr:hypothetical protein [Armatimonadota bacterium]